NDKTAKAIRQFMDEAILRPNPQQVPRWHSDPYMKLVTQYKSFAYAIYDQIWGRITREMQHGNLGVLLPALAYLPVVLAAELLRELIQHGPEGNPVRKDWGVDDYAWLAVDRSGLMGPARMFYMDVAGDVERRRIPGSSQIGPTLSQVRDTAKALTGSRSLGKTFEDALPGSPLWKRW